MSILKTDNLSLKSALNLSKSYKSVQVNDQNALTSIMWKNKEAKFNLTISVYVFSDKNFSLYLSITWLKSFKSPFNTAVGKK